MPESLRVAAVIPAEPEVVFAAWLDPHEHSLMTGSTATDEGDNRFTAWDGYITGRTLRAVPYTTIVQSWRSAHFEPDAPDSEVTVQLEPYAGGGTWLTLTQDNIPHEQADSYRDGWQHYYFEPMQRFFAAMTPTPAPAPLEPVFVAAVPEPAPTPPMAPDTAPTLEAPAVKKTAALKPRAAAGKRAPKRAATKKTVAGKPAAKKAVAKKRSVAKKVAVKKSAAKKAPAKRKAVKKQGR